MKRWVAIASVLVLSGCSSVLEEHFAGFAASDEPTVASQGVATASTTSDSSWDQSVAQPFSPLPAVVASTPEGESGEWGEVVFYVKRVYEAASSRTCREVDILYPDSPEPTEKLACGSANAAFFATVIF